ncbi:pyridoxamine 5'-phosphate oxidase [Pseudidiomarina taiwanensis]|uniref:Pyridoxine/pyridoxamine 5'-phosphate oxidase n=1 Tax=Pseudidiomarina taiwanensis TaxID=337250 RepID=A0A432ZCM6_9GAMM|nr:pyridoxamine 5'-phosphate oxidase [Pseudidiomarina taiwanensis]RUO75727.1 pyridoxamine 5'-phosphate oxidase [Pseudidiomarina taiwanensis]
MDLREHRRDYEQARLTRDSLAADPHEQFQKWFAEALEHGGMPDPTAFSLATVDADQRPHQRIVLLKEVLPEGYVFYTNQASAKGRDIDHNPAVAMHFSWLEMERQVRIEGFAEKISAAHAEEYFHSRPRESQLGALTSMQSQPLADRAELEQRYHELTERYAGKTIPKPDTWGGYLIRPQRYEFWQGGRYRLHDRFCYQKEQQQWHIMGLQP